eukprot:m.232240 g.232240  ORF g.232240 m.232240 type:complete len:149 (+) comp18882_c0_seq6:91-537(+)
MMAYQAYGLSELYAPSLYHPYYLCLGTQCNCGVSPPAGQAPDGIGATVDSFRSTTEPCGTFKGFECHATAYCSNHPGTSPMTNYSYTGPDSLEGCEARCSADPNCSCFVHKLPPSGASEFPACELVQGHVYSMPRSMQGYNAYLRQQN